ncbi:transposase [Streptomyces sp. NPDC057094]|uniref:transposase n=1 Tax=Streptomyces sp. NPDC057094 TaxID=3346018 RepID=UPI00362A9C3B
MINGIIHRLGTGWAPAGHRLGTGCQWRQLPARYGPWQTIHKRHMPWSADGTWERLLQQAQADGGGVDVDVPVDAASGGLGIGLLRDGVLDAVASEVGADQTVAVCPVGASSGYAHDRGDWPQPGCGSARAA